MNRMDSIILNKIVVVNNRVDYFFTTTGQLQKYFKKANHMFLEYNYDISDIPESILAIPFVANVVPLVWITDSKLYINELDQAFYQCLHEIRAVYQKMFPNVSFLGVVNVECATDNAYTPEVEAASLFSGGLDALTTFIRIKDKKPLLITEFGWHQEDIQYSEVWEADKENAINFAKFHGVENVLIQSNYGNFFISENIDSDFSKKLGTSWWQGLHHGLAIISAGIPVAYKLKVKSIYIASSLHVGHIARIASDPEIDNKIKYGTGGVYHDAYELTRQQKVKVVVDYYSTDKEPVNLRVCFKNKDNCCNCEKCLRTILGIVAEGKNPRDFGFDVPINLSQHVRSFLKQNVKFLPPDLIKMVWMLIQKRMAENQANIRYKDLLDWFLNYDLTVEQRKALLHYRVTKFFPILKRKINDRIHSMLARNLNI